MSEYCEINLLYQERVDDKQPAYFGDRFSKDFSVENRGISVFEKDFAGLRFTDLVILARFLNILPDLVFF